MELSVVIPCYNAGGTLGAQLEALSRQDFSGEWEVVVADNGSTDDSPGVVEAYQGRVPGLRLVDASAERGAAYARNVGVKEATGTLILFCDADDVVEDDYVRVMAASLESHDFVASRLEEASLNEPWQIASWPNGQKAGLLESSPHFLPFGGGGTLGMKRFVFDRVGGFDLRLRAREDNDFCWRVQLEGIPLAFVPETAVHYRYPTSLRGMFRQSRTLAEHQVILYQRYRHHGMPRLPLRRALLGRLRWSRLLLRLAGWPTLSEVERARLVRDLADKLGRLKASIRYRTLAL